MNNNFSTPSILLVDDDKLSLDGLENEITSRLEQGDVNIKRWIPNGNEDKDSLQQIFQKFIDEQTMLVATDHDLTQNGLRGLFGDTIVGWCKKQLIPVGDFSRANATALTVKPELFELRIPANNTEGSQFIVNLFHGFLEIQNKVDDNSISSMPSLSAILASILNKPNLDSHFSLYLSRIVLSTPSIVEHLNPPSSYNLSPDKVRIITYLLGHVLHNVILKYPGPILSENSLCSYMATSFSEAPTLRKVFEKAVYEGPFGENETYFWREDIDTILTDYCSESGNDGLESEDYVSFEITNRKIIENELGRKLKKHDCIRCHGERGGFYCPFKERTVCHRADCSESSSSWIPHGADLCRIEREFFDEWSPILGL